MWGPGGMENARCDVDEDNRSNLRCSETESDVAPNWVINDVDADNCSLRDANPLPLVFSPFLCFTPVFTVCREIAGTMRGQREREKERKTVPVPLFVPISVPSYGN